MKKGVVVYFVVSAVRDRRILCIGTDGQPYAVVIVEHIAADDVVGRADGQPSGSGRVTMASWHPRESDAVAFDQIPLRLVGIVADDHITVPTDSPGLGPAATAPRPFFIMQIVIAHHVVATNQLNNVVPAGE